MKRLLTFIFLLICFNTFGQIQRVIGDSTAIGVKPGAKINLDGSITARSFNGKRAITGSVATGQNPNTNDLIAWINAIFYPSQVPTATLTGGSQQELRSSGTGSATLNWSAGRLAATEPISSIVVNGISQSFTQPGAPGTVSGTQSVTLTYNTNQTFTNTVTTTDGKSASATTSFTYLPRRYWGRTSTEIPDNATILAATGGGSELSSSKAKSGFIVTAFGSNRIFFAYPSNLGDLTGLTIGGFDSLSAFVKNVISVTNASGFTQNYNVYVSTNTFSATTPSIITN
jgi:hypothetical protein